MFASPSPTTKRRFFGAILLCSTALLCVRAMAADYTIAVIPKGTTHEYWKSIHAGAMKASLDCKAAGDNVTIIWKGPLKEDDREQQIQVVENFLTGNVKGIVLAPLDSKALVAPVETATQAGVPVVIIDSGLESQSYVSFVATDNYKGGQKAADRLGEVMGGKGKLIVLRYQEGSASTEQREAGFLDEFTKKFPDVKIISSDQHSGATRDTAYQAGQNLLNRFGSEVTGIFTPNESSCAGMVLALRDAGLAGKVMHVGFDSDGPLLDALKAGELQGLVVQDPFQMGYIGVKTMVDSLKGVKVEKKIDTPVQLVTKDNLEDPAIKALINPPLDQYLK